MRCSPIAASGWRQRKELAEEAPRGAGLAVRRLVGGAHAAFVGIVRRWDRICQPDGTRATQNPAIIWNRL